MTGAPSKPAISSSISFGPSAVMIIERPRRGFCVSVTLKGNRLHTVDCSVAN